jgi:predicted short-subunit dehydrogenase-like oxidoreductase (DUF2520 family)
VILRVAFIGAGTVGNALASRLSGAGYNVSAVASRSFSSAERLAGTVPGCQAMKTPQQAADAADLVFVTTPDAAIGSVVSQLKWHAGQSVVHCSGADSTEVLHPAKSQGALVGAFHPLQTFASVKQAIDNLPGSTFAVEADEPLRSTLKQMASDLHGYSIELMAGDKVLYHASAVIACNYFVTLVKLSSDLWQSFGVSRNDAVRALVPLLKGTLNNIENVGIPNCLTGPIARGDAGTVKKHLAALDQSAPSVADIYRKLGVETVPIALDKGKIEEKAANGLLALLESQGTGSR